MQNPFKVVKDFEDAVAEYTGAPYCVSVNSCTNALFLALVNQKKYLDSIGMEPTPVYIPKKTYISVPMQIKHAGFEVRFKDIEWKGTYELLGTGIYDAARRFTSEMFININFEARKAMGVPEKEVLLSYVCVSFHWSKILGIQQGGAILHNDPDFDVWARKARFDGRTEGMSPKDDKFDMLGYHCYLSPEIAAEGLVRLHHLPKHNPDLKNDDYPDLSQMEIFREVIW